MTEHSPFTYWRGSHCASLRYEVVLIPADEMPERGTEVLNRRAKEGWEVHSTWTQFLPYAIPEDEYMGEDYEGPPPVVLPMRAVGFLLAK